MEVLWLLAERESNSPSRQQWADSCDGLPLTHLPNEGTEVGGLIDDTRDWFELSRFVAPTVIKRMDTGWGCPGLNTGSAP